MIFKGTVALARLTVYCQNNTFLYNLQNRRALFRRHRRSVAKVFYSVIFDHKAAVTVLSGLGGALSFRFSHKLPLCNISFAGNLNFHAVSSSEMQDGLRRLPATALCSDGGTARTVKRLGEYSSEELLSIVTDWQLSKVTL